MERETYWYESVFDSIGNAVGGKINADATVATSKNISDSIAGLVKIVALIIGIVVIIRIFKK